MVQRKYVKSFMEEEKDIAWSRLFCDFWCLLDDELKKKYPILGMDIGHQRNRVRETVHIQDAHYPIGYQSVAYRAMSAIAYAEGDYYLALVFMMCVKSCIPRLIGAETANRSDRVRIAGYHKEIDTKIEDIRNMLPYQKTDLLNLKG